jgi:hypothetical protein
MTEEHILQIYEHIQKHRALLFFHINKAFRAQGFDLGENNESWHARIVLSDIMYNAIHTGKTVEKLPVPFLKQLAWFRTKDHIREINALERHLYGGDLPTKMIVHHAPRPGDNDYDPTIHGDLITEAELVDTHISYQEREALYRPLINALQGKRERQIFEMFFLYAMHSAQIAHDLGVSKPYVTQSLWGTKNKDGTPRRKGSITKIREKIEAGAFEESLGSKQQIYNTLLRLSRSGRTGINFYPQKPVSIGERILASGSPKESINFGA